MKHSGSKNVRAAVRNSFFGLSAIVSQLIGTSFAFFIIARIPGLTISDFGMLTYAFALAQLFSTCFEYGLSPYLAKESAAMQPRDLQFEKAGYGLHLTLMCIGFSVFWLVLPLVNLNYVAVAVCKWIGASVFITSTMRFFFAYYQGRERIHLEFFGTFSEMSILLAVTIIAYLQRADAITMAMYFFYGRLAAWFIAYLILGFSEFWLVPKCIWSIWRKILSGALPFGFTFLIAFAITSIDTVMLQQLAVDAPERQVGLYQAALRIVLIPTILAMVVTKVFLPQLSRMGSDSPEAISKNLRYINNVLNTVGLLSGVFVYFYADELVGLAYGAKYGDAAQLLKILSITLVLRFGAAYNLYFALKNMMWRRVLYAVIALVSVVVLNYLLIPRFGAIGVAYASVLTHLIYWIPFLLTLKKFEGEFLFGWQWYKALVAAVFFLLLLKFTEGLPFAVNIFWSALFVGTIGYFSLHQSLRKRLTSVVFGRA